MAISVPNTKGGVFNGVDEEVVMAAPGEILPVPLTVLGSLSVLRFTFAGSVPAIYTITGWASFAMVVNNGVALSSFAMVIGVRPGMVLNLTTDTAGTFKVLIDEVTGGVI